MISVGPQHVSVMLAYMVKSPLFRGQVLESLDSQYVCGEAAPGEYWQSLVFNIFGRHHQQFQDLPDPGVLRAEFLATVEQYFPPGSPDSVALPQKLDHFIGVIVNEVTERSQGLAEYVFHTLLKQQAERERQDVIQEVQGSGIGTDSLADRLAEVDRKFQSQSNTASRKNIMTVEFDDESPRVRTGATFLDARLGEGRGPVSKCAAAIIAGQGCGKTTLGVQVSIEQALLDRPSLLVISEEGMSKEFRRNILACTTGISTPVLEQHGDDPQKAALAGNLDWALISDRLDRVARNLDWVDLVDNGGDLLEVENKIRVQAAQKENPLRVVYIDWAGHIAERILNMGGYRGRVFREKREVLQYVADWAVELSRQGPFIALSQQISPDVFKRGATFEPDQYCAAECRMFTANMKYCFVIGPPCKRSGLQLITSPKTRNDPRIVGERRIVVRLTGEMARFNEVEGCTITKRNITEPGNKKSSQAVPGVS